MPGTLDSAIDFLETQWSSINENKLKGIAAEIRFEAHLNSPAIQNLYEYIIPGGWILTPAKKTMVNPVTKGRIAIIPIPTSFSWSPDLVQLPFAAMVLATSYFRQTGIMTYFAKFETNGAAAIETGFHIPVSGAHHTSYDLQFYKTGAAGLQEVQITTVLANFTSRTGMKGLRSHETGRFDRNTPVWTNGHIVSNLFWKEYARFLDR